MENQTPPQAPAMGSRPWFRLASMRASEAPPATAPPAPVAAPPRPAPVHPPPATGRPPLRHLGSLLSRSAPTAGAVPPRQREPSVQSPTPPQTQPTTPPPTVPTTGAPPRPPTLPAHLATAGLPTQEQQPPTQAPLRSAVTPSPVAHPPAPRSPTAIWLPETTPPPSIAVRQQPPTPPPPMSTLASPPAPSTRLPSPPVRTLSPPPPPPAPRLPSPPPYPEPETKPMVSVATCQSSRTPEPTSGLDKDRNGSINGSGGKTNLGVTQGDHLINGVPAESAAVPGKKKPGSSDKAESRMRVLTLAGENMGAHMNLASGVHRGNTVKGHGRHLTPSRTATQSIEKVAVATGSINGSGDASLGERNHPAAKDVEASSTGGASKWKEGASASAKPMAALVNSNVQSVNNSIMFNSSCTQQSPGVHITLSSGSRRH